MNDMNSIAYGDDTNGPEEMSLAYKQRYLPKRERWERDRDLREIARLYVRGYKRTEITEIINKQYPPEKQLTHRTIEVDLQQLLQEWRADAVREIAEKHAEQLGKLQEVEKELWLAWEKSKEIREVIITEAVGGGGGKQSEGAPIGRRHRVQTRREQAIGDPRYLEGVMKVIEQRSKLLGLNQPEKLEITAIKEMRNEELEELIRTTSEAITVLAANTYAASAELAGEVSYRLEGGTTQGDNAPG